MSRIFATICIPASKICTKYVFWWSGWVATGNVFVTVKEIAPYQAWLQPRWMIIIVGETIWPIRPATVGQLSLALCLWIAQWLLAKNVITTYHCSPRKHWAGGWLEKWSMLSLGTTSAFDFFQLTLQICFNKSIEFLLICQVCGSSAYAWWNRQSREVWKCFHLFQWHLWFYRHVGREHTDAGDRPKYFYHFSDWLLI